MKKTHELDPDEQDIEDNLEAFSTIDNFSTFKNKLVHSAKTHNANKKPITIRVSISDVEAVKIKASKLGIPYQTYINMLIHKDVTC